MVPPTSTREKSLIMRIIKFGNCIHCFYKRFSALFFPVRSENLCRDDVIWSLCVCPSLRDLPVGIEFFSRINLARSLAVIECHRRLDSHSYKTSGGKIVANPIESFKIPWKMDPLATGAINLVSVATGSIPAHYLWKERASESAAPHRFTAINKK